MKQPICTDSSLAAAEPVGGSAPHAVGWLCLEQSGPWGRKAWTQSHLDPELGARIEQGCTAAGVRPSLVRRVGRHPDPQAHRRNRGWRTVLAAHTRPDRSWLLEGRIDDPARLLDLDVAALAAGDLAAVRRSLPELTPCAEAHLLVCTNGARDTCCARLGRPVALSAAVEHTDRVWEVTHTSGHRFAPTTVLLPSGYLHGRVLDAAPLLAATDSGNLVLSGLRGRSTWPAAAQAAEIHVREQHDLTGVDDLVVEQDGPHWRIRHRDGRSWLVGVSVQTSGERAESCGKELKPVTRYTTTLMD